jgi:dihydroorotate dehydrogenase
MRLRAGVCGAPIKWAGIDMVTRLKKIREKKNYTFTIDGVGGVTKPEDYEEYMKAGADTVFSATGAMWNPYLAQEIKKQNVSL